jgi:hypothetical protein
MLDMTRQKVIALVIVLLVLLAIWTFGLLEREPALLL